MPFSLKELLAKNIAQKCTWQTSGEQGNGQGEIIIKGNKFKQTESGYCTDCMCKIDDNEEAPVVDINTHARDSQKIKDQLLGFYSE